MLLCGTVALCWGYGDNKRTTARGGDNKGTGIWYNCGDMKVEDTELLAALKREVKDPQKDIPDEEKVKVAEEVHEWLKGKQGAKAEE